MRFSRLALTGIGMAAGAAVALTGSGEASAALLAPSSYPHTQSLTNGTLTVNVGNETSKTATCWLSIHDASKETQLGLRAAAVNVSIGSGIESAVLDKDREDAAEGALRIVWGGDGHAVSKNSSQTGVWVSNRTDTSYAIYQECTTPDPITGLTINGLAQVYKVTGTGKPADNGGGDNGGGDNGGGDNGGGGDSGNGSLGNLFGSS